MLAGRLPTVRRLVHLKLLQVFQYGPPYANERGLNDAVTTALRFGFTGLLVKALDGTDWMSKYDRSPDALDSIESVARQAALASMSGLYFFCWTNPRRDVDTMLQASLTSRVAKACDGVFLDVEPYPQFWGDGAPPGLAAAFMESIREGAPDAFIALQPDPRPVALDQIRIHEWLPFVDAFAGQHYWTDFGTNPTDELASAIMLGKTLHKPIVPTLPGAISGTTAPVELLGQLPGLIVWRMGTANSESLRTLGGINVTGSFSAKLQRRRTVRADQIVVAYD